MGGEKKMLSKKHVKEINGTEIMYKLIWMTKKINVIVLAKYGVGCSFKPLFKSEEEKNDFITERAEYWGKSFEQSKCEIEEPTYCLTVSTLKAKIYDIRKLIKTSLPDNNCGCGNGLPICPMI